MPVLREALWQGACMLCGLLSSSILTALKLLQVLGKAFASHNFIYLKDAKYAEHYRKP